MASSSVPCAIILLGNSGVGKSFLANRILNDDKAFESRFSAKSVTHETEWKEYISSNESTPYLVGNLPGLVEADQKSVDRNRIEIMKAFEQYPWGIVLFVFGHTNGRLPDEDIVAFTRINDAYQFPLKSLAIIVNGIPLDRPNDYEEKTRQLLQKITHVDDNRIYFIEKATTDQGKTMIHQQLHDVIRRCEPVNHKKKHNIELLVQEISRLKSESRELQIQLLAQEQEKLRRQVSQPSSYSYSTQPQLQITIKNKKSKFIEKSTQTDKPVVTTQPVNNLSTGKYNRQQQQLNHEAVMTSAQQPINESEWIGTQVRNTERVPSQRSVHRQNESRNHQSQQEPDQVQNTYYYFTTIVNPPSNYYQFDPNIPPQSYYYGFNYHY